MAHTSEKSDISKDLFHYSTVTMRVANDPSNPVDSIFKTMQVTMLDGESNAASCGAPNKW